MLSISKFWVFELLKHMIGSLKQWPNDNDKYQQNRVSNQTWNSLRIIFLLAILIYQLNFALSIPFSFGQD